MIRRAWRPCAFVAAHSYSPPWLPRAPATLNVLLLLDRPRLSAPGGARQLICAGGQASARQVRVKLPPGRTPPGGDAASSATTGRSAELGRAGMQEVTRCRFGASPPPPRGRPGSSPNRLRVQWGSPLPIQHCGKGDPPRIPNFQTPGSPQLSSRIPNFQASDGTPTWCPPPSLTFHAHRDVPRVRAVRVGGQAAVGTRVFPGHAKPLRSGCALPGAEHLRGRVTPGGADQSRGLRPFQPRLVTGAGGFIQVWRGCKGAMGVRAGWEQLGEKKEGRQGEDGPRRVPPSLSPAWAPLTLRAHGDPL